ADLAEVIREPEPDCDREAEEDVGEIPELPEECWRFGFQQFRSAYSESTEAADAFLFGGFLVVAGLVLGRHASLESGLDVYPNIYLTNVGASGRSRKTTAQAYSRRLLLEVGPDIEVSDGIGVAEGLLDLLAGSTGEGPVVPRRVLV